MSILQLSAHVQALAYPEPLTPGSPPLSPSLLINSLILTPVEQSHCLMGSRGSDWHSLPAGKQSPLLPGSIEPIVLMQMPFWNVFLDLVASVSLSLTYHGRCRSTTCLFNFLCLGRATLHRTTGFGVVPPDALPAGPTLWYPTQTIPSGVPGSGLPKVFFSSLPG